MTERELFDEACRAAGIGPRLDIENYPDVPAFPVYERTRSIAFELITSANQHVPTLPPLHFDFVDVPQVNAWAFQHNNEYFIAVTAGAVVMLHLVLDRILADPNTLPWIGDPSQERDDLQPVPWGIVDPERLFNLGVRPVVAQDERRVRYSKHLADQALMFLVGHEIAHITRGHVDYLIAATGSSFLAELGWQGVGEQKVQRQAIEADADRRSIYARCYSMFMTPERNAGQSLPWTGQPARVEGMQFDWAFAVNVVFRLFGDKRFSGINLESASYPPLPLRRRLAMDFGCHVLIENWCREHEEKIESSLVGSVKITEDSFLAIGADPAEGGFAEAFSDEASQHIARLSDCWEKLRSDLVPFAYESLDPA